MLRLTQRRFGAELPTDLDKRLNDFTLDQLNELVDTIALSSTLEEWLATFPVK